MKRTITLGDYLTEAQLRTLVKDYQVEQKYGATMPYRENTGSRTPKRRQSEELSDIDAIRKRAHAATKASYSLADVLDERAREFYFEGYRRVDLIRFNRYGGQDVYNWDYKNGIKDGTSKTKFDKTRNLYPLFIDEILANSNLTQIDGY